MTSSTQPPGPTDIDSFPINKCLKWYLVHSYLYYRCDSPVIPDAAFDRICERLAQEYDQVNHRHQDFLDIDALRAGTGFHISYDQYPLIVQMVGEDIRAGRLDCWGNPTPKSEIYNIDKEAIENE